MNHKAQSSQTQEGFKYQLKLKATNTIIKKGKNAFLSKVKRNESTSIRRKISDLSANIKKNYVCMNFLDYNN